VAKVIKTAAVPMLLASLTACATVDHRLAWTAENLRTVAERCGVPVIEPDSGGLVLSGLSEVGRPPPAMAKFACIRRTIRVPRDFIFMTS
jgi:hypothetical protein